MAFRFTRPHILFVLLLAFLLSFIPVRVQAETSVELPTLEEFITSVTNGEPDTLRGVYVPEVLASPIVSQPEGDPGFVSTSENTLTQFRLAQGAGSTGLLAHNYLAGKYFFMMEAGQVFYLVYGDGHTETFIVTELSRYRALDPDNVWSKFIDLQQGSFLSASALFSKMYAHPGHVVLQTCIYAAGNSSWGRLFVVAEPYTVNVLASDPRSTTR